MSGQEGPWTPRRAVVWNRAGQEPCPTGSKKQQAHRVWRKELQALPFTLSFLLTPLFAGALLSCGRGCGGRSILLRSLTVLRRKDPRDIKHGWPGLRSLLWYPWSLDPVQGIFGKGWFPGRCSEVHFLLLQTLKGLLRP